MRILAMDTSTGGGSLALLEDTALVCQLPLSDRRRTAQTFSVAMAEALQQVAWEPSSVGLVAVTNGPGSFTGLRIGVTAAKFFAYATRANLIALNTLDVLVDQLPGDALSACAVMDAQRRQLFAGIYQRSAGGTWHVVHACRVVDREGLGTLLTPQTVLTGPALTRLSSATFPAIPRADEAVWAPQAATVGKLGWRAHQAGMQSDIWQLQPNYYRPSYAEE